VAQAGLLWSSLAPHRIQPRGSSRRPLLAITTVLSVASGVAQAMRMLRHGVQAVRVAAVAHCGDLKASRSPLA
jgi:hypothetical protein